MHRNTLIWFTNNLRLDDNTALDRAKNSTHLTCVFIEPSSEQRPNTFGFKSIGHHRRLFLDQALASVDSGLRSLGQSLEHIRGDLTEVLSQLVIRDQIDHIVFSRHVGTYENQALKEIVSRFPHLTTEAVTDHTLFSERDLPFPLAELPNSFTQFRKKVEHLALAEPIEQPTLLPKRPGDLSEPLQSPGHHSNDFNGRESAALAHLHDYFAGLLPSTYKTTRNGLDDWACSTKLSPWLALGVLSPRRVISTLVTYEEQVVQNDSTYWIYFELLWREYFQWYGHRWGSKLYHQRGPFNRSPLTTFYAERLRSWIEGSTPYPIVNAAMKQLSATGYMSNRARQLVAGCLVHELKLDWRYGAAYFEELLIDHDLASNWGNWQYLGGVGADPRGSRRFNLEKQTDTYDPEKQVIKRWKGGEGMLPLDRVDYHDWPIEMK